MGQLRKQYFYYKSNEAPSPTKPPSIGVVAIIKKDDSILLERRSNSERWAIIGGGINPDETFVDGLIREVKEETGLTVKNISLFGTFSDPSRIIAYPDGNIKRIITIAYEVEVESFVELVCSEESSEIRFIPKTQIENISIAETHIPIIRAYMDDYKGIVLE